MVRRERSSKDLSKKKRRILILSFPIFRSIIRAVSLEAISVGLIACSTSYEQTAIKSWDLMTRGQVDEALQIYEERVTADKERLLRLMDEGILYRVAKRYDESNSRFLEAAKLIEESGYLSLSEQSVTLLTNEKQT